MYCVNVVWSALLFSGLLFVSFQKVILGLWYLFNLTTSKWQFKCKTVQIFTFDFDWVTHMFFLDRQLLCVSEISPLEKIMGSLGIGMKPGFIAWSLSGPNELGFFHHIAKLCFAQMQNAAVVVAMRNPVAMDIAEVGRWWLSGWMMVLFSQKTAMNLMSQPQSHGVSTKFQGLPKESHPQIWSTWILKGCWRMTWISV